MIGISRRRYCGTVLSFCWRWEGFVCLNVPCDFYRNVYDISFVVIRVQTSHSHFLGYGTRTSNARNDKKRNDKGNSDFGYTYE
jgi:hypothetical protein